MKKRLFKYLGILAANGRRPILVSGSIREVTDLRTGETFVYSYQMVARNKKGQIKTQRVLA